MNSYLVVATKLRPPRPPPRPVPRPHLVALLNDGLLTDDDRFVRPLTLLSAPAGFGKSALLGEWMETAPCPTAWLNLDEGDNDPDRFWRHFVAALEPLLAAKEGAQVSAALAGGWRPGAAAPMPASLPEALVRTVAGVTTPLVLVLDDLHLVTAPPIHELLGSLLYHLPSNMHLIISSRADPPWPLARLRARRHLVELRADDLRFGPEEAARFLHDWLDIALTPAQVEALWTKTEGWVAGLQMAALALRRREDVDGFIRTFSGTHRFIFDYLLEEVLSRQPAAVRAFLLQTSILDRFCASLCAALVARDDAVAETQALLARLERANLFLVALDDERRWYRYHHLFADLLGSRRRQAGYDEVALHGRASAWYEAQGLLAAAVRHALAAGDVEHVADLVAGNAFALLDHGALSTLVGWLDALPPALVQARPWLCLARAWALIYAGQVHALDRLLQDADVALPPAADSMPNEQLGGHYLALRAYRAALRGEMPRAAALAGKAMVTLPEGDLAARSWAASLLANALRWQGQLSRAEQTFAEASILGRAAGGSHVAVDVLCDWAGLQIMQGQLRRAVATCEDALLLADDFAARSGRRLPVTGYAHARLSAVLRQWNDLAGALRHARESVRLGEAWGWAEMLVSSYVVLAEALQATGDRAEALAVTHKARLVTDGLSPWFTGYVAALEARLRLAQGDVAAASRWAAGWQGLAAGTEADFHYEYVQLTLARIYIAQRRLREALALLARLRAQAAAAGAVGSTIEIQVLQATALQAQEKEAEALVVLQEALQRAEAEQYLRVFVDQGEALASLLRRLIAHRGAMAYAARALAAVEAEADYSCLALRGEHPRLAEPLTAREQEVLRLLTTHLPSTEIARELTISVNTIRTHIKNIYGKLDVHDRMGAVDKARELGLV